MRVLLAGDRTQDRDSGRRAALGVGFECSSSDCVPLADLRQRLSREPAVHLVVVYLDPDPSAAIGVLRSAVGQSDQPIFAVSSKPAETLRGELEDVGVADLWPLDGVRESMLRSAELIRREGKTTGRRGRVVAVTAVLPGSGVTTVAAGLAFALAGDSVALAELGAGTPELALDLDLQPPHSLAELLRAGDRMDARMVRDAAVRHEAGVDVLAYQCDTPAVEPVAADAARTIEILLRNVFDWSVLDAGHPTASGPGELLLNADAVILVARLDPPSLRLTRWYAKVLAEAGVPADGISIVANRFGQPRQVPWRAAEEALKTKVRAWLPDDPRSVNRALGEGKPLVKVARGAKLTREFGRLATALRAELAPAAR